MADPAIDRSPREGSLFPWRLLIVACLIALVIPAFVAMWFATRITGPLTSASVTREFLEYLPTAGPTDGILETATCSVPETFTQSDSAWLFNIIPLGTTVAEIRVPAIYRYHIQLSDPWKLSITGPVCLVMAPQFQPSLPPAIVTTRMEQITSNGWLRFDADEELAALERGMTGALNNRANDKLHRDFVREACRQSVADFVRTWLLKDTSWRKDRFHQIVVVFPDEVSSISNPAPAEAHQAPSITFDGQSRQ